MKLFLGLMLCGCVLLQDGPSSAEEKPNFDCAKSETQMEMNYCAEQDFDAADAALNKQWKATRKVMVDWDKQLDANQRGAEEALLKAQRAWINYRDGQCEAEGFAARGGTMEPMLLMSCKAELSKVRTEELKTLAETIGQ
ncbi:lysozyme inhibitor LprI family protein [Rhizobium sp. FKY42]|uniref:lysozyme inhibitor LprI family protein n=1 Tax=Rhizobium sp. FKY42 TaxID=2562310 RepID=UPI0010C0A8AF|nr:lysozyme inhibitor LprI family protein [Rhizobium sp. FKY42]